MKPHDAHPGWLVDDDGGVWARERRFGCPNHPYGPPEPDDDNDDDAVRALAAGVWDELGSAAAVATVAGVSPGVAMEAWEQLGICCRSHRWRYTGKLTRVATLEIFLHDNMPRMRAEFGESISGSILLQELARPPADVDGPAVVIPLIRSVEQTPPE